MNNNPTCALITVFTGLFLLQGCSVVQSEQSSYVESYLNVLNKYAEAIQGERPTDIDDSLSRLNVTDKWLQESNRAMMTSMRLLKESKSLPPQDQINIKKKKVASIDALEHSVMYLVKALYSKSQDNVFSHKLSKKERSLFSKRFENLAAAEVFQEYQKIGSALKFLTNFLSSDNLQEASLN